MSSSKCLLVMFLGLVVLTTFSFADQHHQHTNHEFGSAINQPNRKDYIAMEPDPEHKYESHCGGWSLLEEPRIAWSLSSSRKSEVNNRSENLVAAIAGARAAATQFSENGSSQSCTVAGGDDSRKRNMYRRAQ
ncbi:hypothetical protein CQW23_22599 [Capsicum baccatum]|uniref:Uncharacterized protein n=1 Tax=Capsicum baccatum TaxID=33114 RepID=A0A2G2W1C0_CAPBA|nr:hypothetical protein CQW23_22599 [Capsicum baccatum]